jgi:D-alanyl-D-alanine carboxypeptidase (penicillin-binding protein 5/6)
MAPSPRTHLALILLLLMAAGSLVIVRSPVGATGGARPKFHPLAAEAMDPPVDLPRGPRVVIPTVIAPSAIVVDETTGRVLFAKRPDLPLPIASLAKVMTALLVLERSDLGETVTVSKRAAFTQPVVMGLRPGERITVRELMFGLLLRSGNDAAVALAEHVSGSVPAFLSLMNRRAIALGLRRTWFASPNGLDDRGFSTARDLATLTRVALANATFARMVDTDRFFLRDGRGPARVLWNINLFRGQYFGAVGVKTGFTSRAGDCLAAAARRGGRTLVAIVLGDSAATHWQDAFGDAARLLDFGFLSESGALRSSHSV